MSCHALVLAMGLSVRQLDLEGVNPLIGAGIYYGAANTEAALYRDQHVCILGGANSAGQGALFLSRYASHVTMLVRASDLAHSMSQYLVDRINTTSAITVKTGVDLMSVSGDGHLEHLTVRDAASGAEESIDVAALFIFI